MVLHWTYENIERDDDDLKQGDIIFPTDKLRQVLRQAYSYFDDSRCLGFLVVTQCCDLVNRGTKLCKSDYISLAVIQDLETLIATVLDKVCNKVSERVYSTDSKAAAHDLVTRIFNQNEQAFGLFYLHPDEAVKIAEEAVALLRVTVTLPTLDHYKILQEARCGRLLPEFRNKLGLACRESVFKSSEVTPILRQVPGQFKMVLTGGPAPAHTPL